MALLDLDWRKVPPYKDLRGYLHKHLAEIDCARGEHGVYLPTNDAEDVRIHDASQNTARMMRRKRITKFRALPTEDGLLKGQRRYAASDLHVAKKILEKVEARAFTYRRTIVYKFAIPSKGLTSNQASEIVDDIAQTLQVHPYCFGIQSECKGQVQVPDGYQLDLQVFDDIFDCSEETKAPRKIATWCAYDTRHNR